MEFIQRGLQCDYCDYRDDDVPFSEYECSIGRPCPLCFNSLLTMEDYERSLKQKKLIERWIKILNVLKWLNPMHYWRLVFGDKRQKYDATITFRKNSNHEG